MVRSINENQNLLMILYVQSADNLGVGVSEHCLVLGFG
jgi:hypothetical protein